MSWAKTGSLSRSCCDPAANRLIFNPLGPIVGSGEVLNPPSALALDALQLDGLDVTGESWQPATVLARAGGGRASI